MPYEFSLSAELAGPPEVIYDNWMSSFGHTAMTGGIAHVDPTLGGKFDAWDGYINGQNLELEPGRRIVQSWRTRRFTPDDPDSTIEVLLKASANGTTLTLHHRNVPDEHTGYEKGGWQSSYFEPMKRRFAWLTGPG